MFWIAIQIIIKSIETERNRSITISKNLHFAQSEYACVKHVNYHISAVRNVVTF